MREVLVGSRTSAINSVRGWLRARVIRVRRNSETFPANVRAACAELPSYVSRQLETIEFLNAQIENADRELTKLANKDSTCRRLLTVPGVGPVTAIRFVAALDDAKRFDNAHQVEAYLGLTPGEHSSSEKQRRLGITKAGPAALRWALVQAAWAARRCKGEHPMVLWSNEVEKRRGKRVATVALARKMVGILFAIWRDGTFYDRKHHAPQPAT